MLTVSNLTCEYRVNPLGLDIPAPRFSWKIYSDQINVVQTTYRIQVADDAGFVNLLWNIQTDTDQSVLVPYDGEPLKAGTRYYWRVMVGDNHGEISPWSQPAYWQTGKMTERWEADFITAEHSGESIPYLRRHFRIDKEIESATIYATALGVYEYYVNGEQLSSHAFAPGWTNYRKRLLYRTYDATGLLHEGDNYMGAILGVGWYSGTIGFECNRNNFGDTVALSSELHINYVGGTREVITTDGNWRYSTQGPILMSEFYDGETYDARMERSNWCSAQDCGWQWKPCALLRFDKSRIISDDGMPVVVKQEIKPKDIIVTPQGDTVVDFGQNLAGWINFAGRLKKGQQITLKFAEVLDQQGNFYTANLRSAKATIHYTARDAEQTYHPHFTYMGFRYMSVSGVDPREISWSALVLCSDIQISGSFTCDDPLINQLQSNIFWSQLGNYIDIPTDCPQRDERLGWMGDAQMFIRTAAFNMNIQPFFQKWLRDVMSSQNESGALPQFVPYMENYEDSEESCVAPAGWSDAGVICPLVIYQCYADKRLLSELYPMMTKWMTYLISEGENPYLWNTGFQYGDWLDLEFNPNDVYGATPTDLIATAFYANSASLVAEAAEILGYEQDAKNYQSLYERVKQEFNREFVTPAGRLVGDTQTAQVLALMFHLVDGDVRQRVITTLLDRIEEKGGHLATGFLGTPYLCHVLTECGYHNIACKLLHNTDYPSWLYPVTKGATTIWEHWDGIKPDGSFWSDSMNSYNHYGYGSVGDWIYRKVAGLDCLSPGYRRLLFAPRPDSGLRCAEARLETLYGQTQCSWKVDADQLMLKFLIPANCTAYVVLPQAEGKRILVNDQLWASDDEDAEEQSLELGSGKYTITYNWKDKEDI